MSRDAHTDAMLRFLGAGYHQTTQGTARGADIASADRAGTVLSQDTMA